MTAPTTFSRAKPSASNNKRIRPVLRSPVVCVKIVRHCSKNVMCHAVVRGTGTGVKDLHNYILPDSCPESSVLPAAFSGSQTLSPSQTQDVEEWARYAGELDVRSSEYKSKTSALDRAVQQEDYFQAAKLQVEVNALKNADVLTTAHARQLAAVAEEDFATAAVLRDATSQGLTGWWAATNAGSDPWCHVVRISEGYSRLEARAYTPAHLADAMGWGHETAYHQPFGKKSFSDVGAPFFEVVFQRGDDGEISQRHFVTPEHITVDSPLGESICGAAPQVPSAPPPALTPTTSSSRTHPRPFDFWSLIGKRRNRSTSSPAFSDQPSSTPPPSPSVSEGETSSAAQRLGALRGQLAPRQEEGRSPTLQEAYAKAEEMHALAALADLEQRALGKRSAKQPSSTTGTLRAPCCATLIDREHLRLELPALTPGGAPRTINYVRIEDDIPAHDPLAGYYLGSFGVHGPELLLLQRGIIDGEEAVIAHKVTGDPNVPAGQVSFRAKVGPKHALETDVYPSALSVSKRFSGEGCVAEKDFVNSRWAKGELLAFGGASKKLMRLTGNAELGFIWTMNHSKRFLILLSRVNFA